MRSKSTDPELRSIDIVKIAAVRQWHSPHNPELYINALGATYLGVRATKCSSQFPVTPIRFKPILWPLDWRMKEYHRL